MHTNSSAGSDIENICERYRRCYAGLVYDVLEHLGHPNQALSHELMPLTRDMILAGPAFTVKGMTTTEKDEALRYRRLEMIKQMRRPCVEVRDRGTQYPVAIYGELSATSAAAHGAVGALIDGGTRDSLKIIEAGFPVFARYRCPVEAFGRWAINVYQAPILMTGELTDTVKVCPGDFIFGDFDGVLVIPQALTMEVLLECEHVMGSLDVEAFYADAAGVATRQGRKHTSDPGVGFARSGEAGFELGSTRQVAHGITWRRRTGILEESAKDLAKVTGKLRARRGGGAQHRRHR
jgi:regulator of RNase E activity RraA